MPRLNSASAKREPRSFRHPRRRATRYANLDRDALAALAESERPLSRSVNHFIARCRLPANGCASSLTLTVSDGRDRVVTASLLPCGGTVQPPGFEFGCWLDPRHPEMIAGTGAGDIKQVPLGVVDHFEISIIRDIFDALLGGD